MNKNRLTGSDSAFQADRRNFFVRGAVFAFYFCIFALFCPVLSFFDFFILFFH